MSKLVAPQKWKTLYAAAMLESREANLAQQIERASAAIRARLSELPQSHSVGSEQMELQSALRYLDCLKRELPR